MINFILRKFFKAVAENPFLVVEVNCANFAIPRVNNSSSDGMDNRRFILRIEASGSNSLALNQNPNGVPHRVPRRCAAVGWARYQNIHAFPVTGQE